MKAFCKGLTFVSLALLTSFFGTLVLLTPLLPLMFYRPTEKLGKWISDKFIFMWKLFAVALYEVFIGIKINIIGGDIPNAHCSQLIILNHRTRLDWLFLMSYQIRYASLEQFVISLKAPLKHLVGPGWAMQCAAFLFLQRKWELDSEWMTRCIQYFQRLQFKPQLLFFPEGTDFTARTRGRSDAFAEKLGLNKYTYVLHPRTTGFVHLIQQMRERNCMDSVVDVTVGYPISILQGEEEVIYGHFPEEIHFYVESYKNTELPTEPESLAEWCTKVWKDKEERLKEFYEDKKKFSCDNNKLKCDEDMIRLYLYLSMLYWMVFLSFVMYCLVYVWYFKWYCVFSMSVFFTIRYTRGGVDNVLFS